MCGLLSNIFEDVQLETLIQVYGFILDPTSKEEKGAGELGRILGSCVLFPSYSQYQCVHVCVCADAGYCEGGFLLLCARNFFIDHAHFCVDHAPFRSRLSLNFGAARKTTKEPVSFLIVAVVNKTKTPKIM